MDPEERELCEQELRKLNNPILPLKAKEWVYPNKSSGNLRKNWKQNQTNEKMEKNTEEHKPEDKNINKERGAIKEEETAISLK